MSHDPRRFERSNLAQSTRRPPISRAYDLTETKLSGYLGSDPLNPNPRCFRASNLAESSRARRAVTYPPRGPANRAPPPRLDCLNVLNVFTTLSNVSNVSTSVSTPTTLSLSQSVTIIYRRAAPAHNFTHKSRHKQCDRHREAGAKPVHQHIDPFLDHQTAPTQIG